MTDSLDRRRQIRTIRIWLTIFILGLALSGITAFPLIHETNLLAQMSHSLRLDQHLPAFAGWIDRVHDALVETDSRYPFLAYGTDWLAFGHLVIAVAFVGPWLDPAHNKWVITMGLIACAGVLPLALIAGPIRGIPFYWRLIDSSFGIFGAIPLLFVRSRIRRLESLPAERAASLF